MCCLDYWNIAFDQYQADCNADAACTFTGGQCIPASGSAKPTARPTSILESVPADWTCDPMYYDANDGCDCDCGVWDPDCTENLEGWFYCNEVEYVTDSTCNPQTLECYGSPKGSGMGSGSGMESGMGSGMGSGMEELEFSIDDCKTEYSVELKDSLCHARVEKGDTKNDKRTWWISLAAVSLTLNLALVAGLLIAKWGATGGLSGSNVTRAVVLGNVDTSKTTSTQRKESNWVDTL